MLGFLRMWRAVDIASQMWVDERKLSTSDPNPEVLVDAPERQGAARISVQALGSLHRHIAT